MSPALLLVVTESPALSLVVVTVSPALSPALLKCNICGTYHTWLLKINIMRLVNGGDSVPCSLVGGDSVPCSLVVGGDSVPCSLVGGGDSVPRSL